MIFLRRGGKLVPILLFIIVVVAAVFCVKTFVIDVQEQEELIPSEAPIQDVLPTPQKKTSYLFRDDILGRNKDDVLGVLDIEDGDVVSENIMSRNVETTYKWQNTSLKAIYSTVEVEDAKGYNYPRNHQTAVDEAISSTGAMPTSSVIWKDGIERVYDNKLWQKELEDGNLILMDKFDTDQGSILIVTSDKKLDDDIKRSRTEKVFTSVIIGDSSYIDGIISEVKNG